MKGSRRQKKGFLILPGVILGMSFFVTVGFVLRSLFTNHSMWGQTPVRQTQLPDSARIPHTPTIITNTTIDTDIRAGWKAYKKFGLTITYPPSLTVEEIIPQNRGALDPNYVSAAKFYSAETDPYALMPEDQEEAAQFAERYILISLQVYANPANIPLKYFLKQLYSQESIVPGRTLFDLMEPNIQTHRSNPQRSLTFVGNIGENPQKQIFLSHNDKVYIFTLHGGVGGTGSKYSFSAEEVFDLMVSTLRFY